MRKRKFLLCSVVVFLLLISLKNVYAQIEVISYDKYVIFSDEELKTVSVSFACQKDNASVTDAIAKYDNFGFVKATYNGAYYTANLQIFNMLGLYGNKTITISCIYSDSTTETKYIHIIVDKIYLEIKEPTFSDPVEVYNGEYVTSLKVMLSSYYLNTDPYSLQNLRVVLKSSESTYTIESPLISYNGNEMNIIFYVPYDIKEGLYDIYVKAAYSYYGTNLQLESKSPRSLNVRSPIKIEMLSPSKGSTIKLDTSKRISISFKVYEKDEELIDLSDTNFKFKLGDKELEYEVKYDEQNARYVATVYLVKGNDGNKTQDTLFIFIKDYKDYPELKFPILNVEYVVSLKGSTLIKGGKIINAKFILEGNNKVYEFSTDNKGNYNILVPKGTYNVTLILNNIDKIIFYDVEIDNTLDSFIKIDYPSISNDKFRIIKSLVVEISSPYSYAKSEIYYDDTKIVDERNIIALYCDYWNFGLQKCNGDLKKYDYNINIISNRIYLDKFEGNVIISEKKRLYITLDVEKKDYYVGDEIKVTGYIKDFDGNPQSGIEIKYKIKGTDIEGDVNTDENGKFEISFIAPNINRRYEKKELVVFIPSSEVKAENKSIVFNIEKRVRLVGYVEEIVDVYKGVETEIPITISNEGDLDLTDIEIRLAGIKEDWYTFTPSFIETLKAGDKVKVRLRVKITCGNECKDYYFVNMRIKSKEATEDVSFTLRVLDKANTTATLSSKQTQEKSIFSGISDAITGKITSININSSNVNYYIIIAFFIAAFIIITIKKRSRRRSRISRAIIIKKNF